MLPLTAVLAFGSLLKLLVLVATVEMIGRLQRNGYHRWRCMRCGRRPDGVPSGRFSLPGERPADLVEPPG